MSPRCLRCSLARRPVSLRRLINAPNITIVVIGDDLDIGPSLLRSLLVVVAVGVEVEAKSVNEMLGHRRRRRKSPRITKTVSIISIIRLHRRRRRRNRRRINRSRLMSRTRSTTMMTTRDIPLIRMLRVHSDPQ